VEYKGVDLAIRNISDSTIATATFEVMFYDIEGNILETLKHKEVDLLPDTSRAVFIFSKVPEFEMIESYAVNVIRTTTPDTEKIQIRRHELITNEAGEEEMSVVIINISDVKTNAAIIAGFYDTRRENIGTKVVIANDIEPRAVKKYLLKFKPRKGDVISTYSNHIGEIEQ
jgi:hypothetical protein